MKRLSFVFLLAFLIQPVFAQTSPVFENGMAQVVDAFNNESDWIREELWVETEFDSDGDGKLDRVHVAVVRQAQTESEDLKVPVIYGSSPYYAGTAGLADLFWDVKHEVGAVPPAKDKYAGFSPRTSPSISNGYVSDWLPRGFAVVHSESPGTGLSQGCPTVGGINESLAPKAVIDWLNGRAKGYTAAVGGEEVSADWSTGNVGMTGTSYNGTLPLAAATTGVDGLKAIIPVAPNTSYWHYYRSNGLIRHPGGYLGEDIDVLYDFIHSRDSDRRDYCNDTIRDGEYAEGMDRVTGDYNEFWAGRDYLNVIDNVKAATLMAHAFNDWNVMPEHSVRIVEALKGQVPVQMYYHQGGHGGPPPLDMMNKWFTRYLYDVENGVENDPKAWIVREGDERLEPTPYADYPNPESEGVRLFPTKGGQYTAELSLEQPSEQGVESIIDNVSFDGQALANAEYSNHRLLYVTPELTQDVHLSGAATMKVRLAANKPAVNFTVWLVSLPWTEGRRARGGIITRGWFDPQNAESMTESSPLTPGEFVEFEFELQPDDQVIPQGQKIGLMIMSSDRDFTLWPAPGSQIQVDLSATSIELPIVGGRAALEGRMGTH
jgi:X-Pro dipeptidyl-peptidase